MEAETVLIVYGGLPYECHRHGFYHLAFDNEVQDYAYTLLVSHMFDIF